MELGSALQSARKAALTAGGAGAAAGGNIAGRASNIMNTLSGGKIHKATNAAKNAMSKVNKVLGG
jgi:hypothetical protein